MRRVIYRRVLTIEGRQAGSRRHDRKFPASWRVAAYGLADGTVLLEGIRRLWSGTRAARRPVVIFRMVSRIEAQKLGPHRCDAECAEKKHCYYHDFSERSKAVAYGLPDGSVLLKGTRRLWGMF